MKELLNITNVHTLTLFFAILIAVIIFIGMVVVDWKKEMEDLGDNAENALESRMKLQKNGYFNYNRLDEYLRRKGMYRLYPDISPMIFLSIKVLAALLLFVIGMSWKNSIVGLIFAVPGFFLPDIVINMLNNSDNDEMMDDIKSIFDTLKVQTKAGVFLTYSLCECYLIVENPRLKAALLDMTNRIISKNQILGALHAFNAEFDNPYIDTLCITIEQSLESGKSAQILEDLSKQIADMQRAINIKEQEKLDSKIQFLEVLIFAGIIGIAIFALVMVMYQSFTEF